LQVELYMIVKNLLSNSAKLPASSSDTANQSDDLTSDTVVTFPERMVFVAAAVLFLFAMSPSVILMGVRGASTGEETSPVFYVLVMIGYVLSTIGILVRLQGNIFPILRAVPVWLMVGFAFASTFWSISPEHTLSRSVAFLGTTIAAAFLATFPKPMQLRIMTVIFGMLMAISLLMMIIAPSLAIGEYHGERVVRGIYVHKNILGWAACLFSVIAFGTYRARVMYWPIPLAVTLLSVLATVVSASGTGLLGLIIAAAIFAVLTALRNAGRARLALTIVTFGGLFGLIGAAGLILPTVLQALNKTVTLSGRTRIWDALGPAISQRWMQGWGFGGALWDSELGRDFLKYEFFAGNAQSGYVENMINLGAIGCTLFYIPYFLVMVRMLRQSGEGDMYAQTMFAVFGVYLFLAITAPIFMPVNQVFWMLIALPLFEQVGVPDARARILTSRLRAR
jgi:exopolysaccharide production protein ExoQ